MSHHSGKIITPAEFRDFDEEVQRAELSAIGAEVENESAADACSTALIVLTIVASGCITASAVLRNRAAYALCFVVGACFAFRYWKARRRLSASRDRWNASLKELSKARKESLERWRDWVLKGARQHED